MAFENAEPSEPKSAHPARVCTICRPRSAFSGTRHFAAYAELGIIATVSPPICWKPE